MLCVSKSFGCHVKVVTAEQMLELHSSRREIESGFKEIKQDIGDIDSQSRKHLAIEKPFLPLLFCHVTDMGLCVQN